MSIDLLYINVRNKIIMAEIKINRHYTDRRFATIAMSPSELKRERKRVRCSGLPRNQKRRILDMFSMVPHNIKDAVFYRDEFKFFVLH